MTGELELWASPLARAYKYALSGLLSSLMLAIVIMYLPLLAGGCICMQSGPIKLRRHSQSTSESVKAE